MVKLTAEDRLYKGSVQDRIRCGANFRRLRYSGTELRLMPNMTPKGEKVQGSRTDPVGVFFEIYKTYIGKFEIKESLLPKAAFQLGAEWQMLIEDGVFSGEAWQNIFAITTPKNTGLWYEFELARFLAQANLQVTYEVPTGGFQIIDGNSTPITTQESFTAVVSQQQRGELVEDDGLPPVSRLYLEGYMVSPKTTPLDANTGRLLPATITNPTGTLEGEFILIATVQTPAVNATLGSGELIKGLFLLSGDDRA